MRIKVGIIGMGRMGQIRKKVLDEHSGFEVVAVTDIDNSLKSEYPKLFKENYKEVLNSGLNSVFVCTFNDIIPEIVCEALGRGINVFSEKPPGRTVDCIEKMRLAEQESEGILKFGFNHRFHGSVMKAKEIVESGTYGKVLWAKGVYGKSGDNNFESSWRSDKEIAGGGILLDQGIHMADLLLHFLGEVESVKSEVVNSYWDISVEDNAFALMKHKSGVIATLHSSATHWKNHFLLEIALEGALLRLSGILSNSMTYAPEHLEIYKRDFDPFTHKVGAPVAEVEEFNLDSSWLMEVDDFYEAISSRTLPRYGTSEDALNVMKLIFDIYSNGKRS